MESKSAIFSPVHCSRLSQIRSCVCELYLLVPVLCQCSYCEHFLCLVTGRPENLSLSRCKPKYWKLRRNTCNKTHNTCSESEMPMAMTYLHKLCTRVTRLESPWESDAIMIRWSSCILTTITEMISDIQYRKHITLTPLLETDSYAEDHHLSWQRVYRGIYIHIRGRIISIVSDQDFKLETGSIPVKAQGRHS